MIYSALDIARYVVNYCNSNNYEISNLKLQKILYFIQANFVVEKGLENPCFYEQIEAWSFGPVIPEVYHEFKIFGNSQILPIEKYFSYNRKNILMSCMKKYENPFINVEDQRLADEMIDECENFSASQLVDITHRQRPWRMAYVYNMNNPITIESIYNYFTEE